MSEPRIALDYDERGAHAVHCVLIELGQLLGGYRNHVIVVGGLVPATLVRGNPAHVGTLDIDLDLDPDALSEGVYAELVECLVGHGYERGSERLKPFQLRRLVRVDDGEPVPVIVDLLMPRTARPPKNRPPLMEGLRVQGIDGGDVALKHNVAVTLDGYMPDGRRNEVRLHFATIPALLVMKGFAITQRDKLKDAYDIWYCIRHYEGGAEALAEACREVLTDAVARQGFMSIAGKFRGDDDYGPVCVRRFLEGSDRLADMTPEQVQTDAYRRVSRLLALLKDPLRSLA